MSIRNYLKNGLRLRLPISCGLSFLRETLKLTSDSVLSSVCMYQNVLYAEHVKLKELAMTRMKIHLKTKNASTDYGSLSYIASTCQ